jgi:threonine dehydrogenase-like Zn-dependent dehydrogenase
VLECAGAVRAVAYSIKIARRGRRVVLVGVAAPETEVSFRSFEVFRQELTILGTFTNPYATRRAVQILAADPDRWRPLVTRVYPLAQFSEAWDINQRGQGLKVCIRPND